MRTVDDFRHSSFKLLLELDAAKPGMMMLVTSREVTGPAWDLATKRHHDAYEVWSSFLGESEGRALPAEAMNQHDEEQFR
ncbi:MAG: hypothetical protein JWQ69_5906 [Pseudomonas sp.]|nr:hypothetical protein [Pseudomonas sp.]